MSLATFRDLWATVWSQWDDSRRLESVCWRPSWEEKLLLIRLLEGPRLGGPRPPGIEERPTRGAHGERNGETADSQLWRTEMPKNLLARVEERAATQDHNE